MGITIATASSKKSKSAETKAPEIKSPKKVAKAKVVPDADLVMFDDDDAMIKVLMKTNPRREGSKRWKRFNLYTKSVKTIADAKKAGLLARNLRQDVHDKLIEILPAKGGK
jgi:hypothetical protein